MLKNSELNDDESMRLWMSLPYEIRQDVSLASFQVPNQHDNNHQHQLTIQSDDNGKLILIFLKYLVMCKQQFSLDESFQTSIGEFSDNAPETTTNDMHDTKNRSSTKTYSKIVSLMIVWLFLTIILSQSDEKSLPKRHLIVPPHNNVKCKFLTVFLLKATVYRNNFINFHKFQIFKYQNNQLAVSF